MSLSFTVAGGVYWKTYSEMLGIEAVSVQATVMSLSALQSRKASSSIVVTLLGRVTLASALQYRKVPDLILVN